jgi:hypothetical protein
MRRIEYTGAFRRDFKREKAGRPPLPTPPVDKVRRLKAAAQARDGASRLDIL